MQDKKVYKKNIEGKVYTVPESSNVEYLGVLFFVLLFVILVKHFKPCKQ